MKYLLQFEFQKGENAIFWFPIFIMGSQHETVLKKGEEICSFLEQVFGKVTNYVAAPYDGTISSHKVVGEYIKNGREGDFFRLKVLGETSLEAIDTDLSVNFGKEFTCMDNGSPKIVHSDIDKNSFLTRTLSDNINNFEEYLIIKLKHKAGFIKMKPKKNPGADLEKLRGTLSLGGLIISLFIVYSVINWKFYDVTASELGQLVVDEEEEEIIPITEQNTPPPPPPPPPAAPEIIEVVEDDVEVEDIEIEDTEADAETVVETFEEEEEVVEEEIFTIVESMPEFPGGGQAALFKFLQKNIKYPQISKENGIQGTVYVNFVVAKDGKIGNVKVLRGVDKLLDREAIRVVESFPRWIPGKQRGKPVSVQYNLPIKFILR